MQNCHCPIASSFKENDLAVSTPDSPRIKTYENTIRFKLSIFILNADTRLLNTKGTYQTFKTNIKNPIERYSTLYTKIGCKTRLKQQNFNQIHNFLAISFALLLSSSPPFNLILINYISDKVEPLPNLLPPCSITGILA